MKDEKRQRQKTKGNGFIHPSHLHLRTVQVSFILQPCSAASIALNIALALFTVS
jgi:hypothetical protein